MDNLTPELLARACHVFMTLAYPGGAAAVPAKKKPYYDIPGDRPIHEYLTPAPIAEGICQPLSVPGGGVRGFALRLGSTHFPHLKLKMQLIDYDGSTRWVFMVDTHDAFSPTSFHPPPDHPDAKAWRELQIMNRQLKEQIEARFEKEGVLTFNGLLRKDLEKWKAEPSQS